MFSQTLNSIIHFVKFSKLAPKLKEYFSPRVTHASELEFPSVLSIKNSIRLIKEIFSNNLLIQKERKKGKENTVAIVQVIVTRGTN